MKQFTTTPSAAAYQAGTRRPLPPRLLNVTAPPVLHHSDCAPTLARADTIRCISASSRPQPAKREMDTPVHHDNPNIDTNVAATSSQYSGARRQRCNVSFSSLSFRATSHSLSRQAASGCAVRRRADALDPDAAANYIAVHGPNRDPSRLSRRLCAIYAERSPARALTRLSIPIQNCPCSPNGRGAALRTRRLLVRESSEGHQAQP